MYNLDPILEAFFPISGIFLTVSMYNFLPTLELVETTSLGVWLKFENLYTRSLSWVYSKWIPDRLFVCSSLSVRIMYPFWLKFETISLRD